MSGTKTPFEAPAASALTPAPAPADRADEPVLDVDQIQGNIFPGFDKDHQTLLFLHIDDAASFAMWLKDFSRKVATTESVQAFNRLFKSLRRKHGKDDGAVKAVWQNIAFSFAGLKKLEKPGMNLDDFVDEAFKDGLTDPVGSGTAGDPVNWLVGGPDREPDVVIILAGDSRMDLNAEVATLVGSLFPRSGDKGQMIFGGATILFRQDGDTLTGPLKGHEQFGFRDGVSQPGVRGLMPGGSPLTPSQNPLNPGQGKPGQDLLWPGEFVFGYEGQDPNAKSIAKRGKDPLDNPARKAPKKFARNGSFLVFRRLRQDVGMFHRFLGSLATRFGTNADFVGARMVGRWPSGAPVVITPTVDDLDLASDDCRNNNFEFEEHEEGDNPAAKPVKLAKLPAPVCAPVEPEHDPEGMKLPFAGHIRKAYPRNDTDPSIPPLGEETTQTHRLLRRGIPFGVQSASTFASPVDDGVDRGLLFLAYQTSIVDQFEFVTRNWVNNPAFKQGGVGFDPIIGQSGDPSRRRTFKLGLPGETALIETDQEWVITTGGGYFFAPSMNSLKLLSGDGTAPPKAEAKAKKKPKK